MSVSPPGYATNAGTALRGGRSRNDMRNKSMDQEPHLSGTKARAGSSEHVVRYVLGISLVAVIVLFIVIYLLRG